MACPKPLRKAEWQSSSPMTHGPLHRILSGSAMILLVLLQLGTAMQCTAGLVGNLGALQVAGNHQHRPAVGLYSELRSDYSNSDAT
jgi:hypothetical protein